MNPKDIQQLAKWETCVTQEQILNDGVMAITIFDNVLDEENWPVSAIYVRTGIVLRQVPQYLTDECAYKLPNMVGWDTYQVRMWIEENEACADHHPCVQNGLHIFKGGAND